MSTLRWSAGNAHGRLYWKEHTSNNGDDVSKVAKDVLRSFRYTGEGEAAEQRREPERIDGNAAVVSLRKDLGGLVFSGQTIESSGGNVKIRVGGREDEDQNTGIEDVRQCWNLLHGCNKRRRSSGVGRLGSEGQLLGVVRDQHAHEEHTENIEDNNTPEGQLDGLGNGLSRVLGLSDSHTDEFSTCHGQL